MKVCRIVIADDSPDIRLLLRLAIDTEPDLDIVGEAGDGAEAVAAAQSLTPDVMLLDLSMPVMDGLEAIPLIRDISPTTAIVVVSGFLTEEIKKRVVTAGAAGYVEKGGDFRSLVDYVRKGWVDGWVR